MGIRNSTRPSTVIGSPLERAAWALHEFPLKAEQVFQVVVAPFDRGGGPCAFQTTGDRVGSFTAAEGVCPAQTLLLNSGALGFGADIFARVGSAVGFAERVPAGNERNGLFVIHRPPSKRLADIARVS